MRDDLLTDDALAEMQAAVQTLLAQHRREAVGSSSELRRQVADLRGEVSRLADAIAKVGISPALATRLVTAEKELEVLSQRLSTVDSDAAVPAQLLQDAMTRYRALVLNLREVLVQEDDRVRVRGMLSELLGAVMVGADDDGQPWLEIEKPAERLTGL